MPRPWWQRFDGALAVFALALSASLAVVFPACRLALAWRSMLGVALPLGLFAVLAAWYRRRGERRLLDVLRMVFWTILLSNLCLLPFYVSVRVGLPLGDARLARVDEALGFEGASAVRWASAHPALRAGLTRAYDSLQVFCVLAVVVPSLASRTDRAKTLLLAILLCVAATLLLTLGVPAVGPWEGQRFLPTADQIDCGRVVRLLKTHQPFLVDLGNPDPIVALPSWHVILAVLSALALRPLPVAGPLAIVWGALIVGSTLTTGWHYLVDVVVGLVTALAAHAIAGRWLTPRLPD